MADNLGKAVLEITVDDSAVKTALSDIQKSSQETAESVKGIGQAVNFSVWKDLAKDAWGAIKGIAEGIGDLAVRGAEVANVQSAFTSLAGGAASAGEVLSATRSATGGLISDFDLMAAGNKALLLGLPVTAASMAQMGQAAVVLGRAMGQDAKKSMDDLTTALGRGSPLILDNLGLTVNAAAANEAYARALGKPVDQLTEAEKKQAFYNAAMDAAKKKVEEMGGVQLTLTDQVQIARVAFQNFTDQLGVAVNQSPVLRAGMEAAGKAISAAFGGSTSNAVKVAIGAIEDLAIWLAKAAQIGVQTAGYLTDAFYNARYVFNAVLEAIATGISKSAEGWAIIFDKAAELPGIGDKAKIVADGMRSISDTARSAASSFGDLKDKAVQDSNTTATAIGTTSAVLGKVIDAMEAAKGKVVDAAATAGRGIGDNLGNGAELARQRMETANGKIDEAMRKLNQDMLLATKEGLDKKLAEIDIAKENELLKLGELKEGSKAKYDELVLAVQEKYAQMTQAARLHGDDVTMRQQQLMNDVAGLQMTGDEAKLAQIAVARDKEIASLEYLKLNYATKYAELVALVQEKYGLMTAQAQGHFATVEQAAAAAGFKTRDELEQQAQKAAETYSAMKESGKFTAGELAKAWEDMTKKQALLDDGHKSSFAEAYSTMAGHATSTLRSLFGDNKAVAIGSALINASAAITKTFATLGWPAGIPAAAAAAAACYAEINKIRSQQAGFAEGTPGLDFANFGRASLNMLHGQEAVVPRHRVGDFAGQVAAELRRSGGLGSTGNEALMRKLSWQLSDLENTLTRSMRDAILLTQ